MKLNTADYALIISLSSATISLAGFMWNVWSKFLFPKARIRLQFYVACIIGGYQAEPTPTYICAVATNFGPTDITVQNFVVTFKRGLFRKGQAAFINPIQSLVRPEAMSGPFGGDLPKPLKVGDQHTLYFPYESMSFAREPMHRAGVMDNFGRFHGIARRQLRGVKKELDQAFADQPYVPKTGGGSYTPEPNEDF
jgi:hypothetical protein